MKKKEIRKLVRKLSSEKPKRVDTLFHRLHVEAFLNIDCLSCANCCKTLGPRMNKTDVNRMAKYLRMSVTDFTNQYLRVDEDGDLVFQTMPCPFLEPDQYCSIYNARPKACREYPHTDQKNMQSVLKITAKNYHSCPAVKNILDNLVVLI